MKNHYDSLPCTKKWFEMSLDEQLANIGTDIDRVIRWRKRGEFDTAQRVFERSLTLLHLTISDPKYFKKPTFRELMLIKEVLCDYFMGSNIYGSTDELWSKYFYVFNYRAANSRRRID
jgi:hypothetical protein